MRPNLTTPMGQAKQLAEEATEHVTGRCLEGEPVFWMEYYRALVPGHIYSANGRAEFGITRYCEYHYDKFFDEDWTEPDEA